MSRIRNQILEFPQPGLRLASPQTVRPSEPTTPVRWHFTYRHMSDGTQAPRCGANGAGLPPPWLTGDAERPVRCVQLASFHCQTNRNRSFSAAANLFHPRFDRVRRVQLSACHWQRLRMPVPSSAFVRLRCQSWQRLPTASFRRSPESKTTFLVTQSLFFKFLRCRAFTQLRSPA